MPFSSSLDPFSQRVCIPPLPLPRLPARKRLSSPLSRTLRKILRRRSRAAVHTHPERALQAGVHGHLPDLPVTVGVEPARVTHELLHLAFHAGLVRIEVAGDAVPRLWAAQEKDAGNEAWREPHAAGVEWSAFGAVIDVVVAVVAVGVFTPAPALGLCLKNFLQGNRRRAPWVTEGWLVLHGHEITRNLK